MKFKAIRDKVIAKPIAKEDRSRGGIIIPDTVADGPERAEVVSVGTGLITSAGGIVPLEVSVGDTILYRKNTGIEVDGEDGVYILIKEADILGVVEYEEYDV